MSHILIQERISIIRGLRFWWWPYVVHMTTLETKRMGSAPSAPHGLRSRLIRELRKSDRQTKLPRELRMMGHPRHSHNLAQRKFFKKNYEAVFNQWVEKKYLLYARQK